MTSILVVIPTLNESRHIESVLRALNSDLPAGAHANFVVADGGSTDGTQAIVGRLGAEMGNVTLLHNPKRIQSAAVNLAVERFGHSAEILVRCDAHAGYPKGYIASLVATLERVGADAVVVPMDSVGTACLQRAVAWVSDTLVGSGGSAHRGGRKSGFVDHGHHAAFRMESFRRAGGYDDAFTPNEDAELDCRQRAHGSRIYLDADIRMEYHPRATLARLWKQYRAYGRARSRTVRRHPGSMRLRQFAVPLHVVLTFASVLAAFASPWFLLYPLAYLAVLGANAVMLAVRHGSACALLGAPAAAVMHFAWGSGFIASHLTHRQPAWAGPASALAPGAASGGASR
ncbi:MAG: glycosyltransferase family 2 protein [Betaproteobacteria bacterium]|nr:glycosyltransferase family 2 protein [Betaproteobacteria bacterium]MCC6247436.1 glycosyltransferase family 2 protein [Rubrivivax sp.]